MRDVTKIRQSDIGSYSYCPRQFLLDRQVEEHGIKRDNLSATEFGTVIHHAVQVLQKLFLQGREDALETALRTFEHYWHPDNIASLPGASVVTVWLPRQTWGGLRLRGMSVLKDTYEFLKHDESMLLALEIPFDVPINLGDSGTFQATGTMDRVCIRKQKSPKVRPYLSVDDWKGLALETPIPIPSGWTTMGELQVGDDVFGSDGLVYQVTQKSAVHNRPCYRVTFDDGSSIVADNVHLWEVHTNQGAKVLSTEQMRDQVFDGRQRHLRIPNAKALKLPAADLPIDPYVLGCWLGDGNRGRSVISKPDDELFDNIRARGYTVGAPDGPGTTAARTVYGLQTQLKQAGLLGGKVIPTMYLRASREQRLDLLRGLMDTDGTWNTVRRQAVIRLMDEALIRQIFDLVAGLGWRPVLNSVKGKGFGKTFTAYNLSFYPFDENPFLLSRKANLYEKKRHDSWRRLVMSVEPVESVPTQCIQVNAPDSLYLAGHQMVPTHNTGKKPTNLRYGFQWTFYSWASTQPDFWEGTWEPAELEKIKAEVHKYGVALYLGDGTDMPLMPRRGRWLNLHGNTFEENDCGWRTELDFGRMKLGLIEYVEANRKGVFPLNISGSTCPYCPYARNGACGGLALAEVSDDDRYPTLHMTREV